MKFIRFMLVLILLGGVLGCAGRGSPNLAPMKDPKSAAVIGSIKVPGGGIRFISMLEVGKVYAPPFRPLPKGRIYNNGIFIFENLPPGKYYVQDFMVGRKRYSFVNVSSISEGKKWVEENAFDVKAGSIHYFGSLQVTGEQRGGVFTSGKFNISPTAQPGEKEILEFLLPLAKGSGWDQRISQRLSELK